MKRRYTTYLRDEHLKALQDMSERTGIPVSGLIGMATDDFLHPLGWIDRKLSAKFDRASLVKQGVPSADVQYLGSSGSASIVDLGGTARIRITLHGATTVPYTLPEGMKYVTTRCVSPTGLTIGIGASRDCEKEEFLEWEVDE